MARFRRNFLEVVAALGTVMLGTFVVHAVVSWWSASAGFH
jgi:hypothetical protein